MRAEAFCFQHLIFNLKEKVTLPFLTSYNIPFARNDT